MDVEELGWVSGASEQVVYVFVDYCLFCVPEYCLFGRQWLLEFVQKLIQYLLIILQLRMRISSHAQQPTQLANNLPASDRIVLLHQHSLHGNKLEIGVPDVVGEKDEIG